MKSNKKSTEAEGDRERSDTERLDWCERELVCLNDGGAAWTIRFGSIAEPKVLGASSTNYLGGVRQAIDEAMKYDAAIANEKGNI